MCWSATADLVAGAGVAAIGVASVAQVRELRDLPLAALPLLLGAHQIVESAVWDAGGGSGPATVAWAVIAMPLLAVWVPAGVWCAAPPSARRGPAFLLALGVATATGLGYGIATGPVTAEIRGRTVGYAVDLPFSSVLVAGYLMATVGSLLLSGDRRLLTAGGGGRHGRVGLLRAVATGVRLDLVRVRGAVVGAAARLGPRPTGRTAPQLAHRLIPARSACGSARRCPPCARAVPRVGGQGAKAGVPMRDGLRPAEAHPVGVVGGAPAVPEGHIRRSS